MKRLYPLLIVFLLSLYATVNNYSFSQKQFYIDSLKKNLNSSSNDTEKVNNLIILSVEYLNLNGDSSLFFGNEALQLAQKINYLRGQSKSYNSIGLSYHYQGKSKLALENQLKALKIQEETNDKNGIAKSYTNIGIVYWQMNNSSLALENFKKTLEIREEINRTNPQNIENKKGIGGAYVNIGSVYLLQKKYPEAIANYQKGQKIEMEVNDRNGLYVCSNNIGEAYYKQGNYPLALSYYQEGLKIAEEIGNKSGIAGCYTNIGNIYEKQKKFNEAITYHNDAIKLAKETGYMEVLKEATLSLSNCYKGLANYEKALEYYTNYTEIKDSLYNKENANSIAEMSAKYETENKEKEIALLNKDKLYRESEQKKRNIAFYSVLVGFVLLVFFSIIIFRSSLQRKKANTLLAEQNDKIDAINKEITIQKEIIEKKNKDTISSINYAKRIQETILPSEELIKKYLPHSFVLFQPKDIVSGDFYYFTPFPKGVEGNGCIIAAIDCTGHGVPGALMSMIAHSLLNEIIKEKKIITPSIILEELDKSVMNQMKKSEGNMKSLDDGLDISICTIYRDKNEIEFAGAHHSLYHVSNGVLNEIEGNIYSIGGVYPLKTIKAFTNYKINVKHDDLFYMFSDGFQDQFGGNEKRKFSKRQIKQLCLETSSLEMEKQKEKINQTFTNWKGNHKQIDDVLVIGYKINFEI